MNLPHPDLRRLAVAGFAALTGLGTACDWLDLDEKDTCATLPPTQPEDLVTGSFVVNQPMSFCDVVVPYDPEVYTLRTMPTLIEEIDGFTQEWTFPEGTTILSEDDGGAVIRWGLEGGPVCARASNDCTEPGEFACRDVTMLKENVWAGVPVDSPLFYYGAAVAMSDGDIYAINPLNQYAVWKGDPDTAVWEKIADTFPVGTPDSNDYTRGEAIADGQGGIYYLVNTDLFRFNTATRTWASLGRLPEHNMAYGVSLVLDGKLWILERGNQGSPGQFWVFDPADQSMTLLGGALVNDHQVIFERNGHLVFGAGHTCEVSDSRCWRYEFTEFDPETYESFIAPYQAPDGELITVALDFDGFTVFVDLDGQMYRLDDDSDALEALPPNPNFGCRLPMPAVGAIEAATITAGGQAWVIGGMGNENGLYAYFP